LPPDQRSEEIENFQALDPEQLEKFPRLILEQLMRNPIQPTVANTPAFFHPCLKAVQQLRAQFQALDNKDGFSLLAEPSGDLPKKMKELVVAGRNYAGQAMSSPAIVQRYALLLADANPAL
jgi:hypothetical protein